MSTTTEKLLGNLFRFIICVILIESFIHKSPSESVELQTGDDSDEVRKFGEPAAVAGGEDLSVPQAGDASFDR